jgi:hypothetical protein
MSPDPGHHNVRDRLVLAFANLASYGIAAHDALEGDAFAARRRLRASVLARHPHAMGSYVFWTRADDARFDEDGDLDADLVLHCSDHDVVAAVRAACQQVGVHAVTEASGPSVVIRRR